MMYLLWWLTSIQPFHSRTAQRRIGYYPQLKNFLYRRETGKAALIVLIKGYETDNSATQKYLREPVQVLYIGGILVDPISADPISTVF